MFLHKHGYTFFDEPNLTNNEVLILVGAKQEQIKKQEREIKKSQRLSKVKGRR